ncbi:hypothetical protein LAV_00005 [Sphingobium phage Lacusarx]|uniref:DUF4055 domain-containing protein n=1 Tax=Sphingobium phage Lacusarx TaxID=1980139 RepID=A0A1W6DWX4_9CAUD|nr:portal protein [Sphingobium phage Lacusarx]ARK07405.1 hypothetical protein LAV_00005 [Sphingobium phage Lacusarx]
MAVAPTKARTLQERTSSYSRRSKNQLADQLPLFVNYDYANWRDVWRSVRHAMLGEIEIKRQGSKYLPAPDGMDEEQYQAYLDRAVFYNMVYRTVTGLTGAIFRRDPRLLNAGPKLEKLVKRVSKDGLSLPIFTKVIAQDMLSTGRYGVLVDKAPIETSQPYLAGYTCENILDWTEAEIDGLTEVDYVLLREFKTDRRLFVLEGSEAKPNPTYGQFFNCYRILRLVWDEEMQRHEYRQEFYERENEDADLTEDPVVTTPLIYGVPMNRIPFKFFNATTNRCEIEKPPVLDILTLNLSHYKLYAQLQHARFYTANPVYWVSGAQEDDSYHIGPSVVWEVASGERAGLIEFNGQGCRSLESGLAIMETQVASLGGRLIGDSGSAGQSDNQIKLKDRNEQSLLLNVTTVINENFTELLVILSNWLNERADKLIFRTNQDFLLDGAAAREFRAITMMYQAGIMPIEIIYEYFLKAEVIPEYVTLDAFKAMLEDAAQFPNNPDVEAKQEGFGNAQQRTADELARDELDEDARQFDKQLESDEADAEAARKSAEKVAKNQPNIPAAPGAAVQANTKDPAPAPAAPKGKAK